MNDRVAHIGRLQALGDVELPKKITAKELDAQAREIRQIAESRDPDRKRSIVRKYIAAMSARPEERTIHVMVHPLSSPCRHSLVAPKGFEPSISWLRTTHPRPLDDGAAYQKVAAIIPGTPTCVNDLDMACDPA